MASSGAVDTWTMAPVGSGAQRRESGFDALAAIASILLLVFLTKRKEKTMEIYEYKERDYDGSYFRSTCKIVATVGKYAIVKQISRDGKVRVDPDHPHGYVKLMCKLNKLSSKPNKQIDCK